MLTKNDCRRRWRRTITGACAILLAANVVSAAPPVPYEAEYGVYRNDKRIARATVKLEQIGDHLYRYSRHSKGVKGLARLLNFTETETAEIELVDGSYRPKSYQSKIKSTGRKRNWQAVFDWQQNSVTGSKDGEPFEIATESGLQDPASLQLTLRDALGRDGQALEFRMLDGAVIQTRQFSSEDEQGFNTHIGCTDTVMVDRIRANSSRYTTAWYASSVEYVLVQLDHGKKGDARNSMRLERLTIDGKAVTFDDVCAQP